MTDTKDPHLLLGAYLIGELEPGEREQFQEHLAGCADCQAALEDLREVGAMAGVVADPHSPASAPVEAASPVSAGRSAAASGTRKFVFAMNGAILLLAAIAVAVALLTRDDGPKRAPVELKATLEAPSGSGQTAVVEVRRSGGSRVVDFRTDELSGLALGELYELWFVGPGDTPESPNRVSAGTFRPDSDGRSRVRATGAADPKAYPVLSVTREPGDGDPGANGPEVLRSKP